MDTSFSTEQAAACPGAGLFFRLAESNEWDSARLSARPAVNCSSYILMTSHLS